jgi:hypothetical protein
LSLEWGLLTRPNVASPVHHNVYARKVLIRDFID